MAVNIFHPLATLNWVELKWPARHNLQNVLPSSVLLEDKIYYGVHASRDTSFIYTLTTDLKVWSCFDVPQPGLRDFTLTAYHSQLVLVGGRTSDWKVSNKLWVREGGSRSWQQSLPPMPTPRRRVCAVNTGLPEYLIVAGGKGRSSDSLLDTVEVLMGDQWFSLPSIPKPSSDMSAIIYNGNLYFMRGFYCTLESLLSSCVLAENGALDKEDPLWKDLHMTYAYQAVSFGQQLVGVDTHYTGSVYAFSFLTDTWAHVEFFPRSIFFAESSIVTPARELVLIGIRGVLKATLTMSPYELDNRFDVSTLSRLELAGIPVSASLEKNCEKLSEIIGVSCDGYRGYHSMMAEWMKSEGNRYPPTWRSLHAILRELSLEELSQEIEEYLGCPTSLKEQCTSVIMSSLLQQESLRAGQLQDRLPDYVPHSVKHSIAHIFKAYTKL